MLQLRWSLVSPDMVFLVLYCPVLVILCELSPDFFLFLADSRGPLGWRPAAGAHLLQGSTCCVSRDTSPPSMAGTSGGLCDCCLSIIWIQSAQFPLSSHIDTTVQSCSSLCISSFLDPSL